MKFYLADGVPLYILLGGVPSLEFLESDTETNKYYIAKKNKQDEGGGGGESLQKYFLGILKM